MPDIFRRALKEREEAMEAPAQVPPAPAPPAGMSQYEFGGTGKSETSQEKARKAKALAALLRSRE